MIRKNTRLALFTFLSIFMLFVAFAAVPREAGADSAVSADQKGMTTKGSEGMMDDNGQMIGGETMMNESDSMMGDTGQMMDDNTMMKDSEDMMGGSNRMMDEPGTMGDDAGKMMK